MMRANFVVERHDKFIILLQTLQKPKVVPTTIKRLTVELSPA
jgi:hypothetical protein